MNPKELDRFLADLERPLDGGKAVSDHDLEQDGESFMAFAQAFGIKPPKPTKPPKVAAPADEVAPAAVPST